LKAEARRMKTEERTKSRLNTAEPIAALPSIPNPNITSEEKERGRNSQM
jgi:hypothetical protein